MSSRTYTHADRLYTLTPHDGDVWLTVEHGSTGRRERYLIIDEIDGRDLFEQAQEEMRAVVYATAAVQIELAELAVDVYLESAH